MNDAGEKDMRPGVSKLTRQIMVRLNEPLYESLARDADANGRTIAQTVRYHLKRAALSDSSEHPEGKQT